MVMMCQPLWDAAMHAESLDPPRPSHPPHPTGHAAHPAHRPRPRRLPAPPPHLRPLRRHRRTRHRTPRPHRDLRRRLHPLRRRARRPPPHRRHRPTAARRVLGHTASAEQDSFTQSQPQTPTARPSTPSSAQEVASRTRHPRRRPPARLPALHPPARVGGHARSPTSCSRATTTPSPDGASSRCSNAPASAAPTCSAIDPAPSPPRGEGRGEGLRRLQRSSLQPTSRVPTAMLRNTVLPRPRRRRWPAQRFGGGSSDLTPRAPPPAARAPPADAPTRRSPATSPAPSPRPSPGSTGSSPSAPP
jgi:hypothetical protein